MSRLAVFESCGNCAAETENEPIALCDDCSEEPAPAKEPLNTELLAALKGLLVIHFGPGRHAKEAAARLVAGAAIAKAEGR